MVLLRRAAGPGCMLEHHAQHEGRRVAVDHRLARFVVLVLRDHDAPPGRRPTSAPS